MKRFRRDFRIVFRKEFRELLRDRRSLFWLFAPPIILPGLAICAALFIGTQVVQIAEEGVPVLIENPTEAPDLVKDFEEADEVFLVDPPPNPEKDAFGEAVIIVSIPEDFQESLDAGTTATIKLITKDNALITFFAEAAVRSVINAYGEKVRDTRLAEAGLTEAWLNPIAIGEGRRMSTSSVTSNGNENDDDDEGGSNVVAAIFLPLAVTSWLLGGGMGMILDTTVGEKERQTIENILVTPANRLSIVIGKMTVVFIASMLVMSLWLTEGLLLNGLSNVGSDLAGTNSLGPKEILEALLKSSNDAVGLVMTLLVMIIPFTIMINGLVMAWCAFAANYREANLFMALVQLGLPATVLLTIFSLPSDVIDLVYAIPLFGTIIGIRDLFSEALPTTGLILNFVTGSLYAVGSIWLAAWVFNREWSLTRGLQ